MRITVKIQGPLLDHVREDLGRPHPVAYERVGFLTASPAATSLGLLLIVRGYQPVEEQDYEESSSVGAQIGPDAFRKAIQSAFRPPLSLLHIHKHPGTGRPGFSRTDLRSAEEFVPGLFGPIPRMPHGIIVLSGDSAAGLLWSGAEQGPVRISNFIRVDAPYKREWGTK